MPSIVVVVSKLSDLISFNLLTLKKNLKIKLMINKYIYIIYYIDRIVYIVFPE